MSTLTAVRWLLLLSFMTGQCKATDPSNTTTPMCRVPFASIQSNLLSQDVLYNTVMRTCESNAMSKWKYSAFTGFPPSEFYDASPLMGVEAKMMLRDPFTGNRHATLENAQFSRTLAGSENDQSRRPCISDGVRRDT